MSVAYSNAGICFCVMVHTQCLAIATFLTPLETRSLQKIRRLPLQTFIPKLPLTTSRTMSKSQAFSYSPISSNSSLDNDSKELFLEPETDVHSHKTNRRFSFYVISLTSVNSLLFLASLIALIGAKIHRPSDATCMRQLSSYCEFDFLQL
jgi:hypothetical protein